MIYHAQSEQMSHLATALDRKGWGPDDITRLTLCGKETSDEIRALLSERAGILPKPSNELESSTGSVIRVNRSEINYLGLIDRVLHPELEGSGPLEYDINQVGKWIHPDQVGERRTKLQVVYDDLETNGMLQSCASLADLHAIQTMGWHFFREHFAGMSVFALRSAAWLSSSYRSPSARFAPFLLDHGESIMLVWRNFDDFCGRNDVMLRFT